MPIYRVTFQTEMLIDCEKECDDLNRMISASLSNHIQFNSGSSQ